MFSKKPPSMWSSKPLLYYTFVMRPLPNRIVIHCHIAYHLAAIIYYIAVGMCIITSVEHELVLHLTVSSLGLIIVAKPASFNSW